MDTEVYEEKEGEIKDDIKDKGIDMLAKINSYKKTDAFDSNVDMKARLTDRFKGKDYDNSLDMKARLTDRSKGKDYDDYIEMKANLTKKTTTNLDKTINSMTAGLSKKDTSGLNKTIGSMTAKMTKKDTSSLDTNISVTAKITKAKWEAGKVSVGGGLFIDTKAGGGLYKNGHWKPISMAAAGGSFNTGQMFVARESGPELVGRIGNNTAVMNNDQIVSSVANGVARAVASVLGSNQTTVVLEGDAKGLFSVVKREATNYTNATGLAAFPV